MQFDVPQFVESETKITEFLTFRQVLWLAGAGVIVMIAYFSLAKASPVLFGIITFFAIVFSVAFAFLKIGGFNLNVFLKNFIAFIVSSKVYLWQKPAVSPKVIQKRVESPREEKKQKTLRIGGGSRLKQLSTQIETSARQ